MNTLTAYTPLESLLLFQSLATYGAEPSAFSKISDLLKGNPLVRQAKTFDTGRLSPDALRELYLSLLKEDSSNEVGRNGSLEQSGDEGQSNSRKRKLQTPPSPEIAQQAHRLPQLVKRLYTRYMDYITKLIRDDEKKYQGLQQEVEEMQRGKLDEGLRKRESSEPATPTNDRGDDKSMGLPDSLRRIALEVPISINGPTDKAAETAPEPRRTDVSGAQEDVNGSVRDERPKSATSISSQNTQPASLPSPKAAAESSPSPQAPITSSSDQVVRANEEQEGGIAKRSKTPQAQTSARARSAEPRVSNYSRHYVTAATALHSTHLRAPPQPEPAESPLPDVTNSNATPLMPTSETVGQPEELPPSSPEIRSNASISQGPQVPQPDDNDALSLAPSPTSAQPAAETAAVAMASSDVLSPQIQSQMLEPLVGPADTADEQHQVASTAVSDQDQLSVVTPQQKDHPTPQSPRTPAPPEQDVPHPPPQHIGITPSLPGMPSTPSSVAQAQGHPTLEFTPSEPGKRHPQGQGSPAKQDEAQSTSSNVEATQQLSPRLSAIQTPDLSINTRQSSFTTPIFNKKGPRPPPIDTSALTNRSFKPFDRGLISGSPGSPVRPGPDEISPISAPSSPIIFPRPAESEPPSITKSKGKRQREVSVDGAGRAEEDDTDELETRKTRSGRTPNATGVKSRRTRAESAASSAVLPPTRARSRSIISHADELSMDHDTISRRKVKHEQPPTPSRTPMNVGIDKGGEMTDEGARQRRVKRKEPDDLEERVPKSKRIGDILGVPDTPSTLQPAADASTVPQYVLSTRNFARTSATIMNDVGQHKYASIFSSPVKEKDAPGYKDLIYRPQDLKSIKSAIAAGGKAVAAAVGAVSISGGTPTENSPSPGPVGTAVAKNTSLWIPASQEVMPPRGIINSAQLEKELMRMFANAVMFNPGPDRGFGPAFKEKAENRREEDEETIEEDEDGGVVKDTREMFAVVERAVTDWRAAERAVEGLSGKPPGGGTGAGRPRPGVIGKEREEEEADEAAAAATAAATAATDGRVEDKDDGEGTPGTARKRRRL